jgi:preprotein translocase subunit SecE
VQRKFYGVLQPERLKYFFFSFLANTERLQTSIYKMNKISNYFRESYFELTEKVTWPSWIQLQQSTVIVLVATVIITALVWVMDFASQSLLKAIYSLFK